MTINDYNNSNNQDTLCDSPMINVENTTTTTASTKSNLDTQIKKSCCKNLFEYHKNIGLCMISRRS